MKLLLSYAIVQVKAGSASSASRLASVLAGKSFAEKDEGKWLDYAEFALQLSNRLIGCITHCTKKLSGVELNADVARAIISWIFFTCPRRGNVADASNRSVQSFTKLSYALQVLSQAMPAGFSAEELWDLTSKAAAKITEYYSDSTWWGSRSNENRWTKRCLMVVARAVGKKVS